MPQLVRRMRRYCCFARGGNIRACTTPVGNPGIVYNTHDWSYSLVLFGAQRPGKENRHHIQKLMMHEKSVSPKCLFVCLISSVTWNTSNCENKTEPKLFIIIIF